MHALPPVPSNLLKLASAVARWSLALMLGAWVILATIWCTLHWVIVPRIGEFRAQLETRASAAIGMNVKIGALTADSSGLIPTIEISDLRLLDSQGREALKLGRVVAAISPQSALALSVDQLYVDSPELDVRRLADGRFVVAGLVLAGADSKDDSTLADWLFSQKEVVIRNGTLRWKDEKYPQPPLVTRAVDFTLRNGFRSHDMRLDATPDKDLGDRFTVVGKFRQPLMSARNGYWQAWTGQIYAAFDRVDAARLARYASPAIKLGQGSGALRAWAEVRNGKAANVVVDVALGNVSAQLGERATVFSLQAITGRLGGRLKDDGFEIHTEGLAIQGEGGKPWPGGNFKMEQSGAKFHLEADQLDLALLAQVADRLPIEDALRTRLAAVDPKGTVDGIRANWTGDLGALEKFDIQGKVRGLSLTSTGMGAPGVSGLSASFTVSDSGGRANIDVSNGAVDLPGFLDEPHIALTELKADLDWKLAGQHIVVQADNLKLRNQDGLGTGQFKWQTSEPNPAQGRGRFPGVLDLQVALERVDGTSVHRYLPSVLRPVVRHYVRDAVRKGRATDAKLRIKGDLWDMPFQSAKQGEFRVSAKLSDVNLAYVPPSLTTAGSLPWPELTQASADFVLDRTQLQIKNGVARINGKPGLPPLLVTKAEAQIPDLLNSPTVMVTGEARGLLANMLAAVNTSPISQLTGNVMASATATGSAELRLKLNLPLGALDRISVQGSVGLNDSDVQMAVGLPVLARTRGGVNFTERGFGLVNVQARLFGGDVAIQGGTANFDRRENAPGARALNEPGLAGNVVLRAQGNVTAQALRQAKELGLVSRLAQLATGSSEYTAMLTIGNGAPEWLVTSNLTGMALALPPPFAKAAETAVPLRIQISNRPEKSETGTSVAARASDRIQIDIPKMASFNYVRDISGDTAKVLSGSMAIGLVTSESALPPLEGVVANVNLPAIDLDAWSNVFSQVSGSGVSAQIGVTSAADGGQPVSPALAYLPSTVALRTGELVVAGRKFSQVVAGASREGRTWRGNMDSAELSGYAEYRGAPASGAGRLYARLARLTLAASTAKDVEALLDQQPASIPALDIVVEDLELRGKKLGRLELEAINRVSGPVREWRLAKFNVMMPEASFTATGNWASINAQSVGATVAAARVSPERRRTVMNFKLAIENSGELLNRLGMKDVIRQGKGKLEGQVAWVGSPLALDYPTLGGAFSVNVESGQFLKADPGIAKLLGVLSLQSLPRRLALDFRDVFTEGFSFDFVRGDIKIEQGMASTNNLQMKGVNAAVLMEGRADIARETQDMRVVVVPEINAGTASLIATVINPAIGLGTFLAQLLLRRPLIETATQEFHVSGSWADPKIVRVTRKADGTVEPVQETAK